jgi:hypothetical protein
MPIAIKDIKPLRYGTFSCWLFGHKFIQNTREVVHKDGVRIITIAPVRVMACIRCGIKEVVNE